MFTRDKQQKRWGVLILVGITAVLMAGCGNKETANASSSSTAPASVATNPQMSENAKAQAAYQAELGKRQQQLMLQQSRQSAPK